MSMEFSTIRSGPTGPTGYTGYTGYTGPSAAVITEEQSEYLIPELRVGTQSTIADATTLKGASFIVAREFTFNRIIVRATSQAGAPTLTVQIFQTADGMAGNNPTRIATCTGVAVSAVGNLVMTPTEGSVTILRGVCYVLFGRDSATGSFVLRSHATQTYDLLNGNIDTDTHVLSFTTTFSATTTPASIDVRPAGTGDLTGAVTDVVLVVVLKKV